jgi:hypothetical protein
VKMLIFVFKSTILISLKLSLSSCRCQEVGSLVDLLGHSSVINVDNLLCGI